MHGFCTLHRGARDQDHLYRWEGLPATERWLASRVTIIHKKTRVIIQRGDCLERIFEYTYYLFPIYNIDQKRKGDIIKDRTIQFFYGRGLQRDVVWSLLTNSTLVIRVQMRGEGRSCGVSANQYSCTHRVTWSPNKILEIYTSNVLWCQCAEFMSMMGIRTYILQNRSQVL